VNAPADYAALLPGLPVDVTLTAEADPPRAFIHLFVTTKAELTSQLPAMRRELAQDGTIWVSWPKKAAKVTTDLTEDAIRAVALPLGLVDVKVCAVDATWSGLKLVIRVANRKK
jgi:hypothetical protein